MPSTHAELLACVEMYKAGEFFLIDYITKPVMAIRCLKPSNSLQTSPLTIYTLVNVFDGFFVINRSFITNSLCMKSVCRQVINHPDGYACRQQSHRSDPPLDWSAIPSSTRCQHSTILYTCHPAHTDSHPEFVTSHKMMSFFAQIHTFVMLSHTVVAALLVLLQL